MLLLALGACSIASVNQPYDADLINFRSTLMLDATAQAPLTEPQVKGLIAELETRLLGSPYLAAHVSRAEFHGRFDRDFKLRDDYNLLSDTLSVVGLFDREQTSRIGKQVGVELLLGAQVFNVQCDECVEGDQVAAVGQLIDARTGQLVWRVTLMQSVNRTPAAVDEGLRELSAELVSLFNNSLRPKWHRERFKNLTPGLAGRARPSIPFPDEENRSLAPQGGSASGAAY